MHFGAIQGEPGRIMSLFLLCGSCWKALAVALSKSCRLLTVHPCTVYCIDLDNCRSKCQKYAETCHSSWSVLGIHNAMHPVELRTKANSKLRFLWSSSSQTIPLAAQNSETRYCIKFVIASYLSLTAGVRMSMTLETSYGGQQGKGFKEVSSGSKQGKGEKMWLCFLAAPFLLSIPLFAWGDTGAEKLADALVHNQTLCELDRHLYASFSDSTVSFSFGLFSSTLRFG